MGDGKSVRQWIASAHLELPFGGEAVRVSFGQRIEPLNFGMVSMISKWTDEAHNPAGFKSRVRLSTP